ncbi:MAG TPA: hypothetical protein VIS94_14675 [Desulfomonilia bacterium]
MYCLAVILLMLVLSAGRIRRIIQPQFMLKDVWGYSRESESF